MALQSTLSLRACRISMSEGSSSHPPSRPKAQTDESHHEERPAQRLSLQLRTPVSLGTIYRSTPVLNRPHQFDWITSN